MVSSDKKRIYTVEEYLALEERSEIRHELYRGELYAMAGGTVNHNRLTRRVANLLENQPALKGCGVFSENLKVEVVRDGYYCYPDVVVACHPFDLRGTNQIIKQPRVIVEVLSKSTALADRGTKWQRYRKLPSLWYYMLVDQYSATIELFSRIEETDEWINSLYENGDDLIVLPRLNMEIFQKDIYNGIELHPEEEDVQEDA
ncbi:Uma2 family endonuclease [Larkinella knui]|uniref:Uma2 family endonuclease n=1 Tax=Larkinella knui TaxID=2025310 RepID=A0A3P1CYX0_9BACT|nr:Uma2 family endonuclease [Larkinella knui]RRB18300.1 Uma2 family endonuclease [Larkinella knui]